MREAMLYDMMRGAMDSIPFFVLKVQSLASLAALCRLLPAYAMGWLILFLEDAPDSPAGFTAKPIRMHPAPESVGPCRCGGSSC